MREIWSSATSDQSPFSEAEFAAGNLIVLRHSYTIGNQTVATPGHIGIITDAQRQTFIHASTVAGKVEERPLRSFNAMLGCVALEPYYM